MSYRATIACLSTATILAAATFSTAAMDPTAVSSYTRASQWIESLSDPTQTATDGDTTGTQYELLSAIYGHPQYAPADQMSSMPSIDESTLWLARAIYSETKLAHEQELVAWVVRNRVETGYRGETTYKGVVLDPYQFSAFNPNAPKRSFYTHLTPETQLPGWQQALSIAHYVQRADPAYRPFSIKTRHFFSEVSMPGHRFPYWAQQKEDVSPGWNYTVDQRRFRFYEKIS